MYNVPEIPQILLQQCFRVVHFKEILNVQVHLKNIR